MPQSDNKPEGAEVQKNNAEPKPEVGSSHDLSDAAADDLLDETSEPQSPEGDKKPEGDTEGQPGGEGEPNTPEGDEKPEGESNKPTETPSGEPFAKIGDMEFGNQEELLEFTSKQIGMNSWLIGNLKKLHPELFNEDGTFKTAEFSKKVQNKSTSAVEAAETMNELKDVDPADMTPEQKEDYEKARGLLKRLGVVFQDDAEFQRTKARNDAEDAKAIDDAKGVIDKFESDHPLLKKHRAGVADVMEKNSLTIEKAWKVYKAIHDIVEEASKPNGEGKPNGGGGSPASGHIPTTVKKETGALPQSNTEGDLFDEIINARGM